MATPEPAVVAAFELQHEVTTGGAAREPDGAHRCFGAGVDEAHHLDGRHRVDHPIGEVEFGLGGSAKGGAERGGVSYSLDDSGV